MRASSKKILSVSTVLQGMQFHAVFTRTDKINTGTTTNARTTLAKKPVEYPAVVIIIPVTSGPAVWPMSIMEDSAPIDAPICSFFATSAT